MRGTPPAPRVGAKTTPYEPRDERRKEAAAYELMRGHQN